jgi:hypothetical protein
MTPKLSVGQVGGVCVFMLCVGRGWGWGWIIKLVFEILIDVFMNVCVMNLFFFFIICSGGHAMHVLMTFIWITFLFYVALYNNAIMAPAVNAGEKHTPTEEKEEAHRCEGGVCGRGSDQMITRTINNHSFNSFIHSIHSLIQFIHWFLQRKVRRILQRSFHTWWCRALLLSLCL